MSDLSAQFDSAFEALTGHRPFPWQTELYERLRRDDVPGACVVPTGLGKTSVIAVWLLAREVTPSLPRRLVYVVNRRTVVDQTTEEAEKYRKVRPDLRISTLRGAFADNREWSADPSKPAVICGTVDMIGSRLLFSGYGVGFKGKPLQAGFLGQDVLIVHDEAHLEDPFQKLVTAIAAFQPKDGQQTPPPLRVMTLTATPREATNVLSISDADRAAAENRLNAAKSLELIRVAKEADVTPAIVECAAALRDNDRAVLVFMRTVEQVKKAVEGLQRKKVPADHIAQLTGTIRGLERDRLVEHPVFKRFLPSPTREVKGTVYLVCTSAGEVGVNISADDLVCDLSTFDSMAQRFGRVNRFGERKGCHGSTVAVVYSESFDEKKPLDQRRGKSLDLLRKLEGGSQSVNPNALETLPAEEKEAAFAPTPTTLPLTDILLDAWSLTSIRGRMPGRPDVEPYLHGIAEHEEAQTYVAWREEVGVLKPEMFDDHPPRDLLDDYELKPHELLRDASRRVFGELRTLAERFGPRPVWLLDEFGTVDTRHTLASLTSRDDAPIRNRTVLLPHDVGGLNGGGMLDGTAPPPGDLEQAINNDIADRLYYPDDAGLPEDKRRKMRVRFFKWDGDAPSTNGMRRIRTIRWPIDEEAEDDTRPRVWYWYERPTAKENSRHGVEPLMLATHLGDVERKAGEILSRLSLESRIDSAIRLAARWHDFGKQRERWQLSIGRPEHLREKCYAKSDRGWVSRHETCYRHEFGSLLDVSGLGDFKALDADTQDLVLHLIAAHHGMARPHFETDQTLDDDHPQDAGEEMAIQVPRRFARLQRCFGHWGLAYLESILRAADWHASAHPSKGDEESFQ